MKLIHMSTIWHHTGHQKYQRCWQIHKENRNHKKTKVRRRLCEMGMRYLAGELWVSSVWSSRISNLRERINRETSIRAYGMPYAMSALYEEAVAKLLGSRSRVSFTWTNSRLVISGPELCLHWLITSLLPFDIFNVYSSSCLGKAQTEVTSQASLYDKTDN